MAKQVRSVRIPDGRWKAVKDVAAEEDKTASDVVNEAIEEHLSKRERKKK